MTKKQTVDTQEVSFIVKFTRPHIFEGKEYKELDLSGLDDLTAEDLSYCERMFSAGQNADLIKETNLTYCLLIAHKATGLPIEFFKTLKAGNAIKIKNVVSAFLYEVA